MPALGNALDFAKYEGRQFRAHQLGAAPSSPVTGQLYYNTADNTLYWWDGTTWVAARGTSASGPAGGDLTGTYPNPQIAAGVITDADVNALNKDGAAGTASMRTLGTGAGQAAAGNDARFGAPSPPNGTAGGDLSGTYPNPQIGAGVIVDADVAAANKDGAVATPSLRTLGAGATQAMPGNRTLDAINAPVAPVNMGGQRLVSLATPTSPADGTTKAYVDGEVANAQQGLDAKASVKAATTGNLSLTAPGAAIDGVTMTVGDRVLVKQQTAPAENGIYIWNGAAVAMTRTPDADAWAELPSAYTWVEQGTTQADTGWNCTVDSGGTLGTTAVTWVQFSGAAQLTAGAGLLKTGNTVDVGAGAGITVNADTVQVANDGITNAMLADGAVNLASADVTGTLPLTKGGTGQITAKLARETGLVAAGYYSSATHGAGTTIVVSAATHGLRATRGLQVQVQLESTGEVIITDMAVAANGDVTVTFGASVVANTYRVTITG